jgi:hypothetical protein
MSQPRHAERLVGLDVPGLPSCNEREGSLVDVETLAASALAASAKRSFLPFSNLEGEVAQLLAIQLQPNPIGVAEIQAVLHPRSGPRYSILA